MWIILFISVVSVLVLAARMKEVSNIKRSLEEHGGITGKYECIDYSKGPKIGYVLLALLGFGSAIYGIYAKDDTTVALGIMVTFLFIAELMSADIKYKFYYSNDAFINRGKIVRYRSIKDFEKKSIPFAFVTVLTYSGDKHQVPPKAMAVIKEQMSRR